MATQIDTTSAQYRQYLTGHDMTSFQKLVEKKYGIDRDEQIAKRLEQIPIKYKGAYKKAIARKSIRAAVNSQYKSKLVITGLS